MKESGRYNLRHVALYKRSNDMAAKNGFQIFGNDIIDRMLSKQNLKERAKEIRSGLMNDYSGWVEKQMKDMRPYLSSTNIGTSEIHVKAHFREGIDLTLGHLDQVSNTPVNPEKVIVGFAGSFVQMIHHAEKLKIDPRHALMLATRSTLFTPKDLTTLYREYEGKTDPLVLVKAALEATPKTGADSFLERYDGKIKYMGNLKKASPNLPQIVYAKAAAHDEGPLQVMEKLSRNENGPLTKEIEGWVKIPGLRPQTMQTPNWCTITTTSMDLQRLGFNHGQADVVEATFGKFDYLAELMKPFRGPTYRTISQVVENLTENAFTSNVISYQHYELYPKLTGETVPEKAKELLRFLLDEKKPAHIRVGNHTILATGYKISENHKEENKYSVIDPIYGKEQILTEGELDAKWGRKSNTHNGDSRYMMMVLKPKRK